MLKRQRTMNALYDKNADKTSLRQDTIFISAEDIIDLDLLETKLAKGGENIVAETEDEVIVISDDFESEIVPKDAVINEAELGNSRTKKKIINVCDKGVEYLDFENEIISNIVIKDTTSKLIDSRSESMFVNLCDDNVEYLKAKDIEDQYFVPLTGDVILLQEPESKNLPPEQAEGFESVFFPEVYEGIAIETPFFDIDSYKEHLSQSTDDLKHMDHSVQIDNNVNNISSDCAQTSVNDGHNSYIPKIEPITINLDTDDELDDFQDNYDENVYQYNRDSNTHTGVQVKKKKDNFFHCTPRINVAGKINIGSSSEAVEVHSKYQCPICTLCKVFDTTVALNNHLKFEHLVWVTG